ncbi:MAG: M1 family aminopeptidase, partial [Myxococcota bacterium]
SLLGGGGALGGGTLGSGGALGGAGGADPMASMQSAMLEFVTAHEVAHQWWHGLVGSDARAHPWVDESLAQFSAVQYVRERHGPSRAREEAERQVAANYHMMRLSGGADGAVDRPVAAFGGELAYAGLVYGKGPFFYERARARMGNGPFFRALRGYVSANRFRTAGPTDLRDRLARGRPPIARLARRWLDEAHGDADLGRPSPARLLQGFLGPGVDLPPELDGLLQGLGGMLGSDTAGSPGGTGSGADLQQALRALQGL